MPAMKTLGSKNTAVEILGEDGYLYHYNSPQQTGSIITKRRSFRETDRNTHCGVPNSYGLQCRIKPEVKQ